MTLDALDQQILDIFREDARLSNREVARRIGIPESRVRGRIKKLLDDKIIHFSAIINPQVSGYKLSAYVRFTVEASRCREAADFLCARDNVILVATTGGRFNLFTVVLARSYDHLYELVSGTWKSEFGVTDTDVRLYFNPAKHRYDLTHQPS